MLLSNAEMPIIVFIFIIIEFSLLSNQFRGLLSHPHQKKRRYHLFLILLLILYNLAAGLLPNKDILIIPKKLQNFLGYGFGYVVASYFPFYLHKTTELPKLRLHGQYGFWIIAAPLLLFYGILYPINNNLAFTRKYVYIIPAIYGIVVYYVSFKEIIKQHRINSNNLLLLERIYIYFSVFPISITPIFGGWMGFSKPALTVIFNSGFLIANAMLMRHLKKHGGAKEDPIQTKTTQTGPIEISVFDEGEIDEKKYQFIKLKLEEVNQGPCDLSHQFIKQDTGYLLSTKHNCIYSFCLVSEKITILNSDNIIDFQSRKEPYITSNNDRVRYTYRIVIVYGDTGTKPLVINPFTEEEYENWYTFVTQIYKQKEDTRAFVQGNDNIIQVVKGPHGVNKVEYV